MRKEKIHPYTYPHTTGMELEDTEIINNSFIERVLSQLKNTLDDYYESDITTPIVDIYKEIIFDSEFVKETGFLPVRVVSEEVGYRYIHDDIPHRLERGSAQAIDGDVISTDQRGLYIKKGNSLFYYDAATFIVKQLGKYNENEYKWTFYNGLESGSTDGSVALYNYTLLADYGQYIVLNGGVIGDRIDNGWSVYSGDNPYGKIILKNNNAIRVIDGDTGVVEREIDFGALVYEAVPILGGVWADTSDGFKIARKTGIRSTDFKLLYVNKYDFIGNRQLGVQAVLSGNILFVLGAPVGYTYNGKFFTPTNIRWLNLCDDFCEVTFQSVDGDIVKKLLGYIADPIDNVLIKKYIELEYIKDCKRFSKAGKIGNIINGVFEFYKYRRIV